MNKLPDYIDCNNKKIEVCKWYMHKILCRETCAYAKDIKPIRVKENRDSGLLKKIKKLIVSI